MVKKAHRSLEEILNSLKDAEKEFDEKLDKYGLKDIKPKKPEGEEGEAQSEDATQIEQTEPQTETPIQEETQAEPVSDNQDNTEQN